MRPSARIAALIELITEIEEGITTGGAPADIIVGNFFRARRYAGSKDRRNITERAYGILRRREYLLWCASQLECTADARFLVLAYLVDAEEAAIDLFTEEGSYAPDALSQDEVGYVEALKALDESRAPINAQTNMPGWAQAGFEARFGKEWPVAAQALNAPAPVDLRLNKLKTKGKQRGQFHQAALALGDTKLSPIGLRSEKNIALGSVDDYKRGYLEVQDEAAQVASLLVDARPGMQVVDFCAGGGGKSLTVSAEMENKGQLYAFDVSGKRLADCKKRAQRAGSRNIQVAQLPETGAKRSEKLHQLAGICDRVFVDVPCSGTGTWRRSPDQRWRQTTDSLADLNKLQLGLLNEASGLVGTEGRLLYMTCSLLPEENEAIVQRFLDQASDWHLVDYRGIWAEVFGASAPKTLSTIPEALQLSPETHNTDGFFIAVFERI